MFGGPLVRKYIEKCRKRNKKPYQKDEKPAAQTEQQRPTHFHHQVAGHPSIQFMKEFYVTCTV